MMTFSTSSSWMFWTCWAMTVADDDEILEELRMLQRAEDILG